MYKVGVLLSGCGVMDGSEIHEAVITLLALDKEGIEYICMAPNKEQSQVINHLTNQPQNEKRNMLIESARIARGNIKDLSTVNPKDFDAIILPGGFGAACNLSTFANEGIDAKVLPEVEKFLSETHKLRKPIGAICIAPNIIAKIFGTKTVGAFHETPIITIGTDESTAQKLEQMGAVHINKSADDIVIDEENLFVSTPAYMLAKGPKEVEAGITKLVKAIVELIKRTINKQTAKVG